MTLMRGLPVGDALSGAVGDAGAGWNLAARVHAWDLGRAVL